MNHLMASAHELAEMLKEDLHPACMQGARIVTNVLCEGRWIAVNVNVPVTL